MLITLLRAAAPSGSGQLNRILAPFRQIGYSPSWMAAEHRLMMLAGRAGGPGAAE